MHVPDWARRARPAIGFSKRNPVQEAHTSAHVHTMRRRRELLHHGRRRRRRHLRRRVVLDDVVPVDVHVVADEYHHDERGGDAAQPLEDAADGAPEGGGLGAGREQEEPGDVEREVETQVGAAEHLPPRPRAGEDAVHRVRTHLHLDMRRPRPLHDSVLLLLHLGPRRRHRRAGAEGGRRPGRDRGAGDRGRGASREPDRVERSRSACRAAVAKGSRSGCGESRELAGIWIDLVGGRERRRWGVFVDSRPWSWSVGLRRVDLTRVRAGPEPGGRGGPDRVGATGY